MARSAALFETVVVAVSELLPVTLSLGEETVAVFVIVPVVLGAFTTRSKLADAPAARDARVHVTVDVPEQLQPVPLAETNVVPLGIVSDTVTDVAGTALELLVTVMVYVTFPLIATGSGESVFVIERSATWTEVDWLAVLLLCVLSLGDETVAVFVMFPAVLGAVTVIVIFGASAPAARFPPVRLHVTVPDELEQLQLIPVALTKMVPAGSGSVTFTAEASSGPALWIPIV